MVSMQGFLSVVSPDSFLPFVPVFLSSVSEPCPYPSCLCRPSRASFLHCLAAGLYDHNSQTADGSLACARAATLSVHTSTCSVRTDYENAVHDEPRQTRTALLVLALQFPRSIASSLTSDLNGILLCKIFGAGIGNLTVGFLIPRHDRPTLLFYITASLPNILPLHFAELLAFL